MRLEKSTQDMSTMALAASTNDLGKDDAEEFIWTVIEMIAESGGSGAVAVTKVIHFLKSAGGTGMFDEDYAGDLVPNPYFVSNGHEGMSPKTKRYLRNRGFKSLGGAAIGIAGGIGSGITQIDVLSAVQHGSAIGTTTAHMVGVNAAGKGFRKSETVTGWISAIQKAKAAKIGVRSVDLAGAVIPVGALGLATSATTAIARLGIKLTLGKLIARTAIEVHWRAHVETRISGAFGGAAGQPQGPASAIMYEIFTKRGFTRVFGKYDTAAIMREPSGWLALNDKLMLM
jgi:hypothetical protein